VELQTSSWELADEWAARRSGIPPTLIKGGAPPPSASAPAGAGASGAGTGAGGVGGATGESGAGSGAAGVRPTSASASAGVGAGGAVDTPTGRLERYLTELTEATMGQPGCTIDPDAQVRILPPGPPSGVGAGGGGMGGMGPRSSAAAMAGGLNRSMIGSGGMNASMIGGGGRGGPRSSMLRSSAAAAWGTDSANTDGSGGGR
jgi:hypothetical protein